MAEAPNGPSRRALLIGIDRYPQLGTGYDLSGCANDVAAMATVLTETFGFTDVVKLVDAAATRDAILSELDKLAERAAPEDVVVVHYSGHGSQMTDRERDEPDGMDETIVPHDSGRRPRPNRDITDDEIHDWLERLTEKTRNVTLVFDCCHSGTVTRDLFGAPARWAEPDDRPVEELPPSPLTREAAGRGEPGPSGWLPVGKHVLIAGCQDEESSYEHEAAHDGAVVSHGALTYFLTQELVRAPAGATYRDVHERVRAGVSAAYPRQHPQLEGTAERELFGVRDLEPMRFVPVAKREGGTVTLGAGGAHGVVPGSEWDVFPPGTKDVGVAGRLGRVRVDAVQVVESEAAVVEEASHGAIARDARAVEVARPAANPRLVVAIHAPPGYDAAVAALRDQIRTSFLVEEAGDGQPADYRAYVVPRREAATEVVPQLGPTEREVWAAVGKDGRLAMPVHALGEERATAILVENFERLARARNALALTNPMTASPLRGKVQVTLACRGGDGAWEGAGAGDEGRIVLDEGDRVRIEVVNAHTTPVFVSLVHVSATAEIAVLYPRGSRSEELAPGRSLVLGEREELAVALPDDFPFVRDPVDPEPVEGIETLKCFAFTDAAPSFDWLEQEGVRDLGDAVAEGSATEALVRGALTGEKPDVRITAPTAAAGEDWTTVEVGFWIRRRDATATAALRPADEPAAAPSEPESEEPTISLRRDEVAGPTITKQPEPQTVGEGETARFEVGAEGDGLAYQWKRGADDIAGATRPAYELVARAEDDGAEFSVIVSNEAGESKTSLPASLTVTTGGAAIFDPTFAKRAAIGLGAIVLVALSPLWVLAGQLAGGNDVSDNFPAAVAIQLVVVGVVVAVAAFYLALLEFRSRARAVSDLAARRQEGAPGARGLGADAVKVLPDVLKQFGQLRPMAALLAISALLFICATVLAWRGLPAP